jgi:hypothetical protein
LGLNFNSPNYDFQVQRATNGALVCQEWPGFGGISTNDILAANDVPADGQVHGLIAFLFACFGGGTPTHDRFIHRNEEPPQIAAEAFTAALPRALLDHPNGGALACISHVDRAWGTSIRLTQKMQPQLLAFRNAIGRILIGQPVGMALQNFNDRYSQYSTALSDKLEQVSRGTDINDLDLALHWLVRNDAQGYVLLGDPAVRLRAKDLLAAE